MGGWLSVCVCALLYTSVIAVQIFSVKGLVLRILQLSLLSPVSPVSPFSNLTVLDERFEKGESWESGESRESCQNPIFISLQVSV